MSPRSGKADKWDRRFMKMAQYVSSWSKDPVTKVGCVVVFERKILSTGYNGFAGGMDDSPELYADREYKLRKIIHAEQNAIHNASRAWTSLRNSTFYVWGHHVCEACASSIINIGAERVVIQNREIPERWKESCTSAIADFHYTGVTHDMIGPRIAPDK